MNNKGECQMTEWKVPKWRTPVDSLEIHTLLVWFRNALTGERKNYSDLCSTLDKVSREADI